MNDSRILVNLFFLLICLLLVKVTWRQYTRKYIVITPFVLFFSFIVLFAWTGQLYALLTEYATSLYPTIVIFFGTISFILGFSTFRRDQIYAFLYRNRPIQMYSRKYYIWGLWASFILLVSLGSYRYQGLPPVVHIVKNFVSGNVDLDEVAIYSKENRVQLTSGHRLGVVAYRGQGIIARVLRVGWAYLLCISYAMYLQTKKNHWIFIICINMVLTFIYVAGDGTRAPFMSALMMIIVFISFVNKIYIHHVLTIILAFFILVSAMSLISSKAVGLWEQESVIPKIIEHVLIRLGANGYDDVAVIELINEKQMEYHCGGLILEQVMSPIPGLNSGKEPFDLRLFRLMSPNSTANVFASTTFIGMIYADAGIIGVITIFGLYGLFIGYMQKRQYVGSKETSRLVFVTLCVFYMGITVTRGIVGSAFSIIILFLFHKYFCFFARLGGMTDTNKSVNNHIPLSVMQ